MNKKILIGIMLIIVLSGCGKKEESKEEKKYICNEISQYISQYNEKTISFKDFKLNVVNKYNEICSKDETEECKYISENLINSFDKALADDVGCNIFDNENMVNDCLASGDITTYLEPYVGTSQSSIVDSINKICSLTVK